MHALAGEKEEKKEKRKDRDRDIERRGTPMEECETLKKKKKEG